jgi:hypothetical protein
MRRPSSPDRQVERPPEQPTQPAQRPGSAPGNDSVTRPKSAKRFSKYILEQFRPYPASSVLSVTNSTTHGVSADDLRRIYPQGTIPPRQVLVYALN